MRWNCGVTEETVPFPTLRNDKAFHDRFTFETPAVSTSETAGTSNVKWHSVSLGAERSDN